MNCIIVDDEPLAREAVELLIEERTELKLTGSFNNAVSAGTFMEDHPVDLVFLDINMPNVTGLEFARTIPQTTLVVFTTAYAEYALDSYEVDAVDYLVKPIEQERFNKAIDKAISYHTLLIREEKEADAKENIERVENDFMFVKSERRFFKVPFAQVLFIEGLKDYVIIQMDTQRIITRMNLKNMYDLLPRKNFLRINKSYIVNTDHIDSFDSNDVFMGKYEIAIGSSYRDVFYQEFVMKNS